MKTEAHPALKAGAGLALLALLGVAALNLFDGRAHFELPLMQPAPTAVAASGARGASSDLPAGTVPDTPQAVPGARANPATSASATAADAASRASSSPVERKLPPEFAQSLTDIIALLNAERFDEARARLDELMTAENLAKMGPFGVSRLYQLAFNLDMQDENYETASADIQAALESGGLNAREYDTLSYQRSQLFVQMEDYAKATDSLEQWIARPNAQPTPDAYYLLAASYYYQDRFDDARDHMETLMSMPGEKQEAWYGMLSALYLQKEDYVKARPVLEQMVTLYGDERYRKQLDSIDTELQKRR